MMPSNSWPLSDLNSLYFLGGAMYHSLPDNSSLCLPADHVASSRSSIAKQSMNFSIDMSVTFANTTRAKSIEHLLSSLYLSTTKSSSESSSLILSLSLERMMSSSLRGICLRASLENSEKCSEMKEISLSKFWSARSINCPHFGRFFGFQQGEEWRCQW